MYVMVHELGYLLFTALLFVKGSWLYSVCTQSKDKIQLNKFQEVNQGVHDF